MIRALALLAVSAGCVGAGLALRRASSEWVKRLGLLGISTVLCLVVLEVALATGFVGPSTFGVVGGLRAHPVNMSGHRAAMLDGTGVGVDFGPRRDGTCPLTLRVQDRRGADGQLLDRHEPRADAGRG